MFRVIFLLCCVSLSLSQSTVKPLSDESNDEPMMSNEHNDINKDDDGDDDSGLKPNDLTAKYSASDVKKLDLIVTPNKITVNGVLQVVQTKIGMQGYGHVVGAILDDCRRNNGVCQNNPEYQYNILEEDRWCTTAKTDGFKRYARKTLMCRPATYGGNLYFNYKDNAIYNAVRRLIVDAANGMDTYTNVRRIDKLRLQCNNERLEPQYEWPISAQFVLRSKYKNNKVLVDFSVDLSSCETTTKTHRACTIVAKILTAVAGLIAFPVSGAAALALYGTGAAIAGISASLPC